MGEMTGNGVGCRDILEWSTAVILSGALAPPAVKSEITQYGVRMKVHLLRKFRIGRRDVE